ncbi:HAD family hydrolase [Candidatus Neomarinimicrobiota bacterium]
MKNNIELLGMDFDGVIADSISECAVAGHNGYQAFCGNNLSIKTPEEINTDQLNKFRIMRPYIRSGEDYLYLFQALKEGKNFESQKEFDEFQIVNIDRKEIYYQLFYSKRQMMMTSDYKNWIALNQLYNGMDEFLQFMQNKIHIISTKASKYIIEILNSNGIDFNPKKVHQAGRGYSKTDICAKLMKEYNLSKHNMIFVDDHCDTLRNVSSIGIRCMLANWGYNTDKQRSRCNENNLELVDLQQFYKEYDIA